MDMGRWMKGVATAWCLAGVGASGAAAVEIEDFALGTTRNLVALCSAEASDPLAAEAQQACFGYLAGTAHFYRALTEGKRVKPFVCPGRELSRQELADIVVDWAKAHQDHMDELPVESVVRATVARFPCET